MASAPPAINHAMRGSVTARQTPSVLVARTVAMSSGTVTPMRMRRAREGVLHGLSQHERGLEGAADQDGPCGDHGDRQQRGVDHPSGERKRHRLPERRYHVADEVEHGRRKPAHKRPREQFRAAPLLLGGTAIPTDALMQRWNGRAKHEEPEPDPEPIIVETRQWGEPCRQRRRRGECSKPRDIGDDQPEANHEAYPLPAEQLNRGRGSRCQAREIRHEPPDEIREQGIDPHHKEQTEKIKAELLADLENELKMALLPKDPADEKDVIIEIRAGTGGDEAGLFASDLFRMYQRYAERRNWKTEVLNTSINEAGGYREIVFEVHGRGAYSRMKYESGVHRVQRVPQTETQGRIHTSTATVAVMPEVDEVDVEINWDDVRIDIYHSGGAGGQNVNKVATAVRYTHNPTGIVVTCQDERSQTKNREKAAAILRARLYELERSKQAAEQASLRKAQVGSGDRAEKVRTYNFPQDRITDHRVGLTVHSMPRILDGEIDALIDAVAAEEQARLLATVGA